MINGNWSQLVNEAHTHWQHALAAAGYIKQVFPLHQLIQAAVVAIVTAILTSVVTVTRLEEKIIAIKDLQAHQDTDHRSYEHRISGLEAVTSRLETRQTDVIKRLERSERREDRK